MHAAVTDGADGDEIAPVRWDDNDVALLPGESRTLTARLRPEDLHGKAPAVRVEGWNAPAQSVVISR